MITEGQIKELSFGKAECVYMPNGDHGLEGYSLGVAYHFKRMKMNNKTHFRLYPTNSCWYENEYFETCGSVVFKRYFKTLYEI